VAILQAEVSDVFLRVLHLPRDVNFGAPLLVGQELHDFDDLDRFLVLPQLFQEEISDSIAAHLQLRSRLRSRTPALVGFRFSLLVAGVRRADLLERESCALPELLPRLREALFVAHLLAVPPDGGRGVLGEIRDVVFGR